MTSKFISSHELNQWLNKSLVLSSRQRGWNGILVEQYQNPPTNCEAELPALSNHWLNLPLGHPVHLTQKRDEQLHESTVQKGGSIFVPAGQPSYWRSKGSNTYQPTLRIHILPELIAQVAETSELDSKQINLTNCFSKYDPHLHNIAMLLLAELQSDGIMGQLYVESLTQVLVIHLLRHYSTFTQTVAFDNRSLTHVQLQHFQNILARYNSSNRQDNERLIKRERLKIDGKNAVRFWFTGGETEVLITIFPYKQSKTVYLASFYTANNSKVTPILERIHSSFKSLN